MRAEGLEGDYLFFRDRRAEKIVVLALLLSLPSLFLEMGRRKWLPGSWLFTVKISSNDTAAIATLRNLSRCQEQIQASSKIDEDGDGVGEFGTFAEMTGSVGVRTDADGCARGAVVSPPILSPALANVDGSGIVTKSGYCFRIFLPGEDGGPVHEGRAPRTSGSG